MNLKKELSNFLNSSNEFPLLVIFASGLYPFLHFYNSNLSMADSIVQCLVLALVCFILPLGLMHLGRILVKYNHFSFFKPSYLSIINLSVFSMLLVRIIFHLRKEWSILILLIAIVAGLLIHKHLKKVVILQLFLATISLVTLVPKIMFAINQNNKDWNTVPTEMLQAKLIETPNIFVIQPDGYVNIADLNESPYSYDNSVFESWLSESNFRNYPHFRSNYCSTLTSNSSMFAMKHHYYGNTNPNTLKTHNANNIIVGDENNVLKILKNNNYKSYLVTDNSYFLANRRDLFFDYTNVPLEKIPYLNAGDLEGIDLLSDFSTILDTIKGERKFFFIEKVIPTHIAPTKRMSKGIIQEKIDYLNRLGNANFWLKRLIKNILEYDKDAMIVIVADHGGYVGLEYTGEIHERKLKEEEVISSFSSILSIRWPKDVQFQDLEFKTNVNLFAQIFYGLSRNTVFLDNEQKNSSYLQLVQKGKTICYESIDENRNAVFNPIVKN